MDPSTGAEVRRIEEQIARHIRTLKGNAEFLKAHQYVGPPKELNDVANFLEEVSTLLRSLTQGTRQ